MSSSWHECELGDVVTLKRGYDLPKRSREPGPIPIVSSSGVTGEHSEAKVEAPGVVTGRYGTLGKVFYVPTRFWPLNTTLYVRDFKGNDERFVAFFLEGLGLERYDGAAAVPGLDRNVLHRVEVRCPDLPTQRKIAAVLAAYDELIENNLRRIEILEEMAQAIYREWFVNFRYPGHEHDTVTDSPLGPIPEAWEASAYGDIAEHIKLGVDPDGLPADTPHVGLEHIPREAFTLREWGALDGVTSRKWSFEPGDILFGRLRPYFHKVARAPVSGVCSTDAIVIRAISRPVFGLMTAFSKEFVNHAVATSGGTDRPRAKWDDLAEFKVALPPVDLDQKFTQAVGPMIKLAEILISANQNLRATRDLLLPSLISGELDVSDLDIDTSWLAA